MPADPAPAVQQAPTTEPAPATTDTSSAVQPDSTPADTPRSTATATTKRVTRHTVAKAALPATRVATATTTARSIKATVAPAPARPTPAAAPASAPGSPRPAPIVDLNAKQPMPTPAVAAKPAKKKDSTLPIAGGALAFLAIGGAAAAITRRRHNDDEEWTGEEATAAEPIDADPAEEPLVHEEQPAIVAPSAIAWERPAEARADEERREGGTYVDRAYGGPTPDNPSLSLRKRLKRAAFMDKRERDVAAGRAVPVDATAGLPERMVEEHREREADRA